MNLSLNSKGYDVSPAMKRANQDKAHFAEELNAGGRKSQKSVIQVERQSAADDAEDKKCCWGLDCTTAKWTIFRFVGLCLIAILILCIVYGLKKQGEHGEHRRLEDLYAVGDRIYARDLWLVIELPSDSRGRRTRLGKEISDHVCGAIKAGQSIGWTPLVVGGRSTCCRSSRCRHLHPSDLEMMNHTVSLHFWHDRQDVRAAMRSAAFLAAIKKGAQFVFQANPETYHLAGVSAEQYQSELQHQLRKMTLGISVGLVKQSPSEKYHFDPYAHFSPDHEVRKRVQRRRNGNDIIHKYKVCEIRPPSLEKFLDQDGFSVDRVSPALTLPGDISSPFDSRNTLFARDALWSLVLLSVDDGAEDPKDASYVLRSAIAQAVLAEIGGSTKFSVAKTPIDSDKMKEYAKLDGPRIVDVLEFISDDWKCGDSASALVCQSALVQELVAREILPESSLRIMEYWTQDLIHVGYRDILTVKTEAEKSPCIGGDALEGVYFHPAVQFMQNSRSPKALDFDGDTPKPLSTSDLNRRVTSRLIQNLCPTVDVEKSITDCIHQTNQVCDRHDNILLIVTFNRKEYESIPLLEVMYRHHFQNILYCGEPDEVVDQYMEQYNELQGTYFSFLPAHSKTGYECLLGAIEMGYNVEDGGYLVVTHDTLINSWNFADLDQAAIWHGNEHLRNVSRENIVEIDPPEGENIMKSTLGILKAFEFLEEVLLKSPSVKEMTEHMEHDNERRKRLARYKREPLYDGEDDQDYDEDEVKETSEDRRSRIENNWHISLFGEIAQDDSFTVDLVPPSLPKTPDHSQERAANSTVAKNFRNVTELLFHPANFKYEDDEVMMRNNHHMMHVEHFDEMMFDIGRIYRSISEKLQFWKSLSRSARRGYYHADDEESLLNKDLEQFQCDVSTNSEICHLVADFFQVLETNEGPNFHLFFDDLPIYYVPAQFKDKLYLMTNLLTKYHVADEMAFPLLLRGLSHMSSWTDLVRSDRSLETLKAVEEQTPSIDRPQDLLLLGEVLNARQENLAELEAAHYIHPVKMNTVLKNEAMKDVICRNF